MGFIFGIVTLPSHCALDFNSSKDKLPEKITEMTEQKQYQIFQYEVKMEITEQKTLSFLPIFPQIPRYFFFLDNLASNQNMTWPL